MSSHYALVLARLTILILGAFIVYLSYKSHRKNHSSAMFLLSVGFSLITAGVLAEGVLFEFFGADLFTAHTVESAIVALGLFTIIYSIYGTRT